eukprot:383061_1
MADEVYSSDDNDENDIHQSLLKQMSIELQIYDDDHDIYQQNTSPHEIYDDGAAKIQINSEMIKELATTLDELNEQTLDNYKDKIIEYFTIFEIDDSKMNDKGMETFCDEISDYCNDQNIKSQLQKVYKLMTNAQSQIINDLIKEIDDINDKQLNKNKDKIIQYFKINNIDYNKLKQ